MSQFDQGGYYFSNEYEFKKMSELSEGFRVILSDPVQALDSVIEKYEALK